MSKNAKIIETLDSCVLFSYATPVAFVDKKTLKAYRTTEKFSMTTTKHINRFFDDYIIRESMINLSAFNVIKISQEELNQRFPMSVIDL